MQDDEEPSTYDNHRDWENVLLSEASCVTTPDFTIFLLGSLSKTAI